MFWKNLWNHSLKYSPLLGRDFRNSQNYVTLHRNWNFFIYVIHRETKMKTSFYQEERYLEPFSSTSNTYCMPAEIVPGSWTAPPLRFFFRKQKDISLRKILLLNQDFETREISPLAFSQLSFPNAPVPAAGGSRGPAATATGLLSTRPRPGREGPDKPRDTHPAVLAVYLHDTSPGVAASPPVLTWGPSRRGPGPAALHTGSLPPLRHGGAAAAAPARRRSPPRAFRSRSRSTEDRRDLPAGPSAPFVPGCRLWAAGLRRPQPARRCPWTVGRKGFLSKRGYTLTKRLLLTSCVNYRSISPRVERSRIAL